MDETTRRGSGAPGGPAAVPGMPATGTGPVAERMQALLSKAVEEQVSEQRQASAVLGELRLAVGALSEQLRASASADRVEQLAGDLASLTTELRRYSTGIGERLDAVVRRVDEQAAAAAQVAAAGGATAESLSVRLSALGDDVAAQGSALAQMSAALQALSSFPDSLSALQGELTGLHDRLAPLGEVRAAVADLAARTSVVEALRPELAAVAERVGSLATGADVTRARDSLVVAVGDRLDTLERAAARPVLQPEDVERLLAPVNDRLAALADGGQAVEQLGQLGQWLSELDSRLDQLADQVGTVRESAAAVPGLATDLALVANRLDGLGAIRDEISAVQAALAELREDSTTPAVLVGVTSLQQDLEDLAERVDAIAVPTPDAVAQAVSGKVADRIVDALAPRVAEVVLTRVASVLVEQVASTVTASVQNGLTERVRAATAESERRMSAHVDEAILALAEALLRRRRPARGVAAGTATPALDLPPAAPGQEGIGVLEGSAAPAGQPVPQPQEGPGKTQGDAAEPLVEAEPASGEDVGASGPEDAAGEPGKGAHQPAAAAQAEPPAGPAEPVDRSQADGSSVQPAQDGGRHDGGTGDGTREDPAAPGEAAPIGAADGPNAARPSPAELDEGSAPAAAAPVDGPTEPDFPTEGGTGGTGGTDVQEPAAGGQVPDAPPAMDVEPDEPRAVPAGQQAPEPDTSRAATRRLGPVDGPAERTGALALRSGLRGLGLDVEDPDLAQPGQQEGQADDGGPARGTAAGSDPADRGAARQRPAHDAQDPPEEPAEVEPAGTPQDSADEVREARTAAVRTAPPVRPRPEVQQRFASAANTVHSDEPDDAEDRLGGPRRRPWWRPGG